MLEDIQKKGHGIIYCSTDTSITRHRKARKRRCRVTVEVDGAKFDVSNHVNKEASFLQCAERKSLTTISRCSLGVLTSTESLFYFK